MVTSFTWEEQARRVAAQVRDGTVEHGGTGYRNWNISD